VRPAAATELPTQCAAAAAWLRALVACKPYQEQGQERGGLHRKFRTRGGARSTSPPGRRLDLRPHTQSADRRVRWCPVLQRRRLGGELQRAGGTPRRQPGASGLAAGRRCHGCSDRPGRAGGVRLAIVTDAWKPQVNGVVTTLTHVGECLARAGHTIRFITPLDFRTVPCPTYPEIGLALRPGSKLRALLDAFTPECIHIATEGPLGWAARAYCLRRGLPFTSAYHTQFPQYLRLRAPIPLRLSYALLRRFHNAAARTLVATQSVYDELSERGFRNLVLWPRGVDASVFKPYDKAFLPDPRPIALYVGRVAVEKNIEAFLRLSLPGTKIVVGDGPDLERLRSQYPQVRFVGYRRGKELARYYAAADLFVFPSRTDTFGLTMLEAMA